MSPTIAGIVPSPTMPTPDLISAYKLALNGFSIVPNTIFSPYPKGY